MKAGDFPEGLKQRLGEGSVLFVAICVVMLGLGEARNLFVTWGAAPMEAMGWVAFVIWLLPLFLLWRPGHYDLPGLICGLGCLLWGVIDSSESLSHIGLAVALGGLLPFAIEKMAWLISGVGWMPAYAADFGVEGVLWVQAGTVLMGLVIYAWAALLKEEPAQVAERPIQA